MPCHNAWNICFLWWILAFCNCCKYNRIFFYCVERKSNAFERPWECVNDERILTFGQTITLNNERWEFVRTEWIWQYPALGWACSMYFVSLCCLAFSCCFSHWLSGQCWRLTGVGYNADRTRECLQYTFYTNTQIVWQMRNWGIV